jgi:hypothetical protein
MTPMTRQYNTFPSTSWNYSLLHWLQPSLSSPLGSDGAIVCTMNRSPNHRGLTCHSHTQTPLHKASFAFCVRGMAYVSRQNGQFTNRLRG